MNNDVTMEIIQLKLNGKSRKEIADIIGVSERQVKRKLHNWYSQNGGYNSEMLKPVEATHVGRLVDLSEQKKAVPSLDKEFSGFSIGQDKDLFSTIKYKEGRDKLKKIISATFGNKKLKILALNDLHIPFHDIVAIKQAIQDNLDADICIMNGDFLDLFAVSTFPKDKNIELKRELKVAREILEVLSKTFKLVILIDGNHERRLSKYVVRQIDSSLQFLFQKDVLHLIAGEFDLSINPNWGMSETEHYEKLSNVVVVGNWWASIGDCVFAHPDTFSSVPARTVISMSKFLQSRNIYHTCVMIGHTHKVAKVNTQGVLVLETGCLCHDMDYHNTGHITYEPWVKAYGVVYLDEEGKVDFNKTAYIEIVE